MDGQSLQQLLGSLLSGDLGSIAGLSSANTGFLDDKLLQNAADYLEEHRLNPELLVWTEGSDGKKRLMLPEEQWDLIQQLELNVFYDDGEGYIDLGLDNVYTLRRNRKSAGRT